MIDISGLRKSYGQTKALNGVDIKVDKGEFYGMLGPNGAGKSTLINILSTVIKADEGEISIDGCRLADNPSSCKMKIGVVPQEIALYEDLSAYDNLVFWGGLYITDKKSLGEKAMELAGMFGLADRAKDKIGSYSGGMKRRINIAIALMHTPEILLLDEPTVGIDAQSRLLIYDILEKLNKAGTTIIYTTHYIDEVERLCSKIGIIDYGRIIAEGTVEELKRSNDLRDTVLITPEEMQDDRFQELKSVYKGSVNMLEDKLIFTVHDLMAELPEIIRSCNETAIGIKQLQVDRASLESIFLSLTGRNLRDN